MIQEFTPSDVLVSDTFMTHVTQKDVDFLNTFDPDILLYNFRLTAGIIGNQQNPAQISGYWHYNTKKAETSYSGWENTRIGGHTLGHYLAAAAQAIARGFGETKGKDGGSLFERLSYLVESLAECQDALGTGFIFGATMADPTKPELQFDLLEQGTTADTWVPWYTAHKLMNGLVEAWKSSRIKNALIVAEKFGEWIYRRTSRWSPEIKTRVLSVEYGGMNDCLYELYKSAIQDGYADSEHFLRAAEAFDEVTLFESVNEYFIHTDGKTCITSNFPDVLNNRHANTTIPKFVGAMNRYCTTGDTKYLEYADAFWNIVVNHHTYITGGNSECEHFGMADILDAERSNANCETCNTHNMLKLTRMLFMATGNRKYADYYENTFINSILASVNAETGMTLYFQPMASGLFKTYCNPDVNKNYFWCCTGTGLENFTKLGDSFYFHTDDTLIVNMYASSSVHWKEKAITLVQKTDIPMTEKITFRVIADSDDSFDTKTALSGTETTQYSACEPNTTCSNFSLSLRIPDWVVSPVSVAINGNLAENTDYKQENGYIIISREWTDGDTIELLLPSQIVPHHLPDNKNVFAFKYGPLVMAAELSTEKKYIYQIGIMCDVAGNKYIRGQEMTLSGNYGSTSGLKTLPAETIRVKYGSVSDFMHNINEHLSRIPGTLSFVLHDTVLADGEEPFVFVPYYKINEKRYGIYWVFADSTDGATIDVAALSSGRTASYNSASTSDGAASENTSALSNYTTLQSIGVGYGTQTEGGKDLFPFMEETGAGSVGNSDELTRFANPCGSFSYMMNVLPNKRNFLVCTLLKADDGKTLRITAGGKTTASFVLKSCGTDEKYTQMFEIPPEIVEKAAQIANCDGNSVFEEGKTTAYTEKRAIRVTFCGADKNDGNSSEKPGTASLQSARIAAPLEIRFI